MAFSILFALFALAIFLAILNLRRYAEAFFLLALGLSVAVYLHHATDTLAISL